MCIIKKSKIKLRKGNTIDYIYNFVNALDTMHAYSMTMQLFNNKHG